MILHVNELIFLHVKLIVACAHFTQTSAHQQSVAKLEKFESWMFVAWRFYQLIIALKW